MERTQIDRRELGLRVKHRVCRQAAATEAAAPLQHRSGDGPGVDEDLMARIDAVLADQRRLATDPDGTGHDQV